MFDLSPLEPEAQPIVEAAATIYIRHARPWFVGLLVHGSALKGGFIAGSSDVDFQLYLEEGAFYEEQLRLEIGLAIQRDLVAIDPAPFRFIQCIALSHTLPEGFVGPIPGAYHLLAGSLLIPEATPKQLLDRSRRRLSELPFVPSLMIKSLLEHGGGRLEENIRLLCSQVWPTLCDVVSLQGNDTLHVWSLPKPEVIELLSPETALGERIRAFHQAVSEYYPDEDSIELALAVVKTGVAFLQEVRSWWRQEEAAEL